MTDQEEAYVAKLEAKVRRYEAALRDAHRTIVESNAAESWSDVLDLITAALADDAQPPAEEKA